MKKSENKKSSKYQVPESLRKQASDFIKDFMKEQGVNASKLAIMLNELDNNRSSSRTNILNKLARASFQLTEVMQIVDVFGYELKILPKTSIEGHESLTDNPSFDNK